MDRTVPLNAIQKAMFKAMTKSLSIPQLGYKDDINLNETQKYRESLNHYIAQKPDEYPFKKISYLPIFIKCMSLALTQYPILNAKVEENGLRYRSSHNIGIAMDTPNGLLVPNIKNVQDKTIFQIASEIHRLLALGQQGKLGPHELRDGTITLSNIGTIGGTYANPVIVSSEISIVALGSIRKLPSYDGERTVPKHTLPISWSADHRVIDGATMARFSNLWKSLIENPALLASMLH
jgi:2-oxoisovalerate dehydrogenase E2 component (dihydrolipoyl transacylase)